MAIEPRTFSFPEVVAGGVPEARALTIGESRRYKSRELGEPLVYPYLTMREKYLDVVHLLRQNERPVIVELPSDPHTQGYFDPPFWRHFNPPTAPQLQSAAAEMLYRVSSSNPETHRLSGQPIVVDTPLGEVRVVTKNGISIARNSLLDIALPGSNTEAKKEAAQQVLIITADQLVSAYLALDGLSGLEFGGQSLPKDASLAEINLQLENLGDDKTFKICADKNRVLVEALPFPEVPSFKIPRFSLITPTNSTAKNTDLTNDGSKRYMFEALKKSAGKDYSVVVSVKYSQAELVLQYLRKFCPARIAVGQEGGDEFKIYEGVSRKASRLYTLDRDHRETELPPVSGLDFRVLVQFGHVDGRLEVHEKKRIRRQEGWKRVAGCIAGDIVQSGGSLVQHHAGVVEQILKLPSHATMVRALKLY